jgi:phage gp29-like protein
MGAFTNFINSTFLRKDNSANLAANTNLVPKGASKNYVSGIVPKTISQTRKDIKEWLSAQQMATAAENAKRYPLYNLYAEIQKDLHLRSQINNRMLKSLSKAFVIKDKSGNVDEELTLLLNNQNFVYGINKAILETVYNGHSLIELNYINEHLTVTLIPRQNVEPVKGLIFYDYTDDGKKLDYRNQKEYGSWLMEFGDNKDLGLLNGCVPHVLFKRFGQSCWSELAEIYGIPPRVMKTNTQDKVMTNRAKQMMTDMGSAAWFIIDDSESFEFAKGVNTNGDVYKNLITLCNNEMSMGISGAVVGQDTANGSNAKETASISIVQDLVDSDLTLLEQNWNTTVIPGLVLLGIVPEGSTFGYDPTEDLGQLWKMTTEAANFLEIDPKWVKTKFGIEVIGAKKADAGQKLSLNFGEDFFV